MEIITTPTELPPSTETLPQKNTNDPGMIKFLVVFILLLILVLTGSWVLKKRG
jgi:hypothetical protein